MKEEKYFFNQVTDGFFENPNEVIKFANTLDYGPNPKGNFPGVRSHGLHLVDYNFFNSTLLRIFSLFYDYSKQGVKWDNVEMYFQKTYPFDPTNKNKLLNTGLVHQDGSWPLVGLIYLTPNADLNSGTCLCTPIKLFKNHEKKTEMFSKRKSKIYKKLHKDLTSTDLKEYEKLLKECNSNFKDTVIINNVFNRLITYSGTDHHKTSSFFTNQKERLTLVFFVREIQSSSFYPLQRLASNKIIIPNDKNKKKSRKNRIN